MESQSNKEILYLRNKLASVTYKRDRFKIAVVVGGENIAEADDFNKKNAEQIASEKAMLKLGILSLEETEIPVL